MRNGSWFQSVTAGLCILLWALLGPGLAAAQMSGVALEADTDRPGSDYLDFDLPDDPQQCARACASDPQCRAFTFVRPGVQGDSARCWLKQAVPASRSSDCCVSGVVQRGGIRTPPASANPAFRGEGFEVTLEFDGLVDGQPHGSHFKFPPQESGVSLQPSMDWQGNRFEGFLKYDKPGSIDNSRWQVQYRIQGSIAADHRSLEGITLQYQAECRLADGTLFEYYTGSFALTDVPAQAQPPRGTNPRGAAGPDYLVMYGLDGGDQATLSHVRELTYRHGYPSAPETAYEITATTLSRVRFRFSGW